MADPFGKIYAVSRKHKRSPEEARTYGGGRVPAKFRKAADTAASTETDAEFFDPFDYAQGGLCSE